MTASITTSTSTGGSKLSPVGGASGRMMRRAGRLVTSRIAINVLALVIAVVIWQLLAAAKSVAIALPTPAGAARGWWHIVTVPGKRADLITTLQRVGVGFALGSATGIAVGVAIGQVRFIREALEPYLHFFRSITPVAWIVPATIWFGVGSRSLLFIVVYATVFPVVINTVVGFGEVPTNKVRMARMFGASRLRVLRSVTLPSAVPYCLAGMRLAIGYAFMSVVAAEMVVGNDGIGYLIFQSRVYYDTETMFGGVILVGMAGFAADRLFVLLTNRMAQRFFEGRDTQ